MEFHVPSCCPLADNRNLLSFILCIALVLSGNSWSGLTAVRAAETGNETGTDSTIDTGSTAVYYGNGYSVTIEVTAKWNSGFNANVTIKNTSNEEIRNWELIMTGADSISNIWNAKKLSQEDGSLKIGNDGWNQDIAAGSSVNFGFQSLTDSAAMPVECYLAGDRQDAEEEDYRIVFRAINTWEGGCVVETDILNLTDKDIEDWDVAFTWKDIRIADIWNAVIDTDSDGSYTIINDTYNSIVPANGKVTFGMRLDTGTGELIFPSDVNGKNEQELFSTTASISAGTLNLALNKDLKEGEYYVIKEQESENSEIRIDSKTLFIVPEKTTDDETIINLMDVWDTEKALRTARYVSC